MKEHVPVPSQAFLHNLQQLEKQTTTFLKQGLQCQKENKIAILKQFQRQLKATQRLRPVLKKHIEQIAVNIPPRSILDDLYEEVIELNKKVESKPTLQNRQAYQNSLNNFLSAYNKEPAPNQQLWKAAAKECQQELSKEQSSIKAAEKVKKRIDNLEEQEQAKIYCIVKGTNAEGQQWGRIDYIGAAYVMAHKNSSSGNNNLPLQIHYYTYTDGTYQLEGISQTLKTGFDKQLMDAFQKSGLVSYEQYKNLGRDYEYKPSLAPKQGKGPWYLTMYNPIAKDTPAKIIEVPDWEDYGFEKLYDSYLDDCHKGILSKTAAQERKRQMQEALSQQQLLIKQLETFHHHQNDQDENTAILLEVWKKRHAEMERGLKEDLKDDCIPKQPALPPCKDFAPIYEQHIALCERLLLPERAGDVLKAQLAACIQTGEKVLVSITEAIAKYQAIPNWQEDEEIVGLIQQLEQQKIQQEQDLQQQREQLEQLPKECLKPIPLEVFFDGNSNKIVKMDEAQIDKIVQLLVENPILKMRLIGNTSIIGADISIDNPTIEDVETDHLMPNDELPAEWTEEEKEKYRRREPTIKDLMLIRVERLKDLFIERGVSASQIECQAGRNLGRDGDSIPTLIEKQKVIAEVY